MSAAAPRNRPLARICWAFVSVPILVKIVGIGAIVASCFGIITFVRTRNTLTEDLNALLAEKAVDETETLAAHLARPLSLHDIVSVRHILEDAMARHPDFLYIIVREPGGEVFSHTFDGPIPRALAPVPPFVAFPERKFRVYDRGERDLVFEALRPVVKGHAGSVQLGLSRQVLTDQLDSLRNTILASLAFCAALGIGLALLLSIAMTHPIHRLVEAVRQIREHNLHARAPVFFGDEIGGLAMAFNDMAEMLEQNEKTINEKEAARSALVRRVITSQETERKLIAQELHDQIGQSLLALLVDMKAADRKHVSGDTRHVHLGQIEDIITEVRQVSKGMHPSILDDYGLDTALKNYAKEASIRHKVRIDYEATRPHAFGRLPEPVEVALYRVAQEAISNALRHGHPEHVSVVLLISPDSAMLLVEDDGKGFDPGKTAPEAGIGLLSMKERVSLLGGELDIVSEAGVGATVRARIPLKITDGVPA